jgi:predicted amidohydrolase YtcJ
MTNGKIITVDDTFSIAQAVAIRGSRIVAVGTIKTSPDGWARDAAESTSAADRCCRGFIDNHAHFRKRVSTGRSSKRLDGSHDDASRRSSARWRRERERCRPVGVHARWLVPGSVHDNKEKFTPR